MFELECYFHTAIRLALRNKTPRAVNVSHGFVPLYNPGNAVRASHLHFTDNSDPTAPVMKLLLNHSVEGRCSVEHSPDILLTIEPSNETYSIYECKMSSQPQLDLKFYREFIGFLVELGLTKTNNRSMSQRYTAFPDLAPRIYTTAIASRAHRPIETNYGFVVEHMA